MNTIYGGSPRRSLKANTSAWRWCPLRPACGLTRTRYDFNLGWIDTTGLNPLSKLNFTDTTWNNYTSLGQTEDFKLHTTCVEWLR